MASYWGQKRKLHFVKSKGPIHVDTSSSSHSFRFFVASFSWLGRDALFLSLLSSPCRRVALLVSSCCPLSRTGFFVS